jgi:hypothetical protein
MVFATPALTYLGWVYAIAGEQLCEQSFGKRGLTQLVFSVVC